MMKLCLAILWIAVPSISVIGVANAQCLDDTTQVTVRGTASEQALDQAGAASGKIILFKLETPICLSPEHGSGASADTTTLSQIRLIGAPPPLGIPLEIKGKLSSGTATAVPATITVTSGRRLHVETTQSGAGERVKLTGLPAGTQMTAEPAQTVAVPAQAMAVIPTAAAVPAQVMAVTPTAAAVPAQVAAASAPGTDDTAYIAQLRATYEGRLHFESSEAEAAVRSYHIDCRSKDGRYLPLINVLYSRLAETTSSTRWLEDYILAHDGEIQVIDTLWGPDVKNATGSVSFEIDKSGTLQAGKGISSATIANSCRGSYGPIWQRHDS